jgi:bifunctional non-homologous end joining protein LigD
MPVTWVKPELVCEIKFSEWTQDGKLRHPIFLHLRPDKKPEEVTKDSMKTISKATAEKKAKAAKRKETKSKKPVSNTPAKKGKTVLQKVEKKGVKVNQAAARKKKNEGTVKIGNIEVKVSNPDKIFWPEEGYTKGDVVKYYLEIADYILPYLKDRPESLKRNPNGINDQGFYQKDAGEAAPEWVDSMKIFSESVNKDIDYIICNNKATITYLNNLGCIELNPWHSTIMDLDKPDYIILDIDPSEKNTFEQVIEAANVINDILKRAKVESFCKTSGATGLHVYVPVGKQYTYDQVKDFAHLICMMANEELPEFTSLERNLKKRGKNKIYLDHLQNRRGQTIASAYSLRPHPGATVSMPLKWSEVKSGLSPKEFDIRSAPKRLKKIGDIFKGILGKGIDIQKCLKQLAK